MMKQISYSDIDSILKPWAAAHRLIVLTDCKGEETRAMFHVDQWGDQYELYAVPDWKTENTAVTVGADLTKRGNKKHTFFRERRQFHHRQSVALTDLDDALDKAWNKIGQWSAQTQSRQSAEPSPSPYSSPAAGSESGEA